MATSAESWYGRFYIGHLHVSERQRIRDGHFNPQEREKLARDEDPWEHLRNPLPPDLHPPSQATTAEQLEAFHKLLPKPKAEPTIGEILNLKPEASPNLAAQPRQSALPRVPEKPEPKWPNDRWSRAARKWLEIQRNAGVTYSTEKEAQAAYVSSQRPEFPPSSGGENLGEYLPRALAAIEAEQEASRQRLKEYAESEYGDYPPPLVEYFKEQERRQEAAEKARIAGLEQAFDNALARQEKRRPFQGATTKGKDKLSVEFWMEIKKNRGWLLPVFLLSGLPLFIATVWGPIMGSKTIPDWLAENGWPHLTTLVLGWLGGVTIIALAIVARSYLMVRERRANKRDLTAVEIARKLKEYQEAGEKILRRCAREALAPVVQITNWQDEVEVYIKENVGEFQSIEFSKSAPITVYPNQACNRDLTNKVYTQIERVGHIISELRSSS